MTSDALDSEYENGVADLLAAATEGRATVERNVYLPGRVSGQRRQIDVYVHGPMFGESTVTMVVDCKRYSKPVNVKTIDGFFGLVEDVGADLGLLVTTVGITPAAQRRADNARGLRLSVLPIDALKSWRPRGTVAFGYAVPDSRFAEAARACRRAGFRVTPFEISADRDLPNHLGLTAFRHFGSASPSGEDQRQASHSVLEALRKAKVPEPIPLSTEIVIGGGTPAHQWHEVTVYGARAGLRVLASDEDELGEQLRSAAEILGLPRLRVDAARPDQWPAHTVFPNW